MLRVDKMRIVDHDTGEEELVCGVALLRGGELDDAKLVPCEGSTLAAQEVLNDFVVDSEGQRVYAGDQPEEFLNAMQLIRGGGYSHFTEPYDDDDSLYDAQTGKYLGDAENPPIPDGV